MAVVKVSWWDCFKGFLLGPKNVERKIAATTKIEFAEDEDAGEEVCDVYQPFLCPRLTNPDLR